MPTVDSGTVTVTAQVTLSLIEQFFVVWLLLPSNRPLRCVLIQLSTTQREK